MKRSFLTILACMLASIVCAPARAQGQIRRQFEALDKNGDGKLSAAEASPHANLLQGADTDKDGFITLLEARVALGRVVVDQLKNIINKPTEEIVETAPPPLEKPKATLEVARMVPPGERGVGRRITDFSLTDYSGASIIPQPDKALVIALVSSTCPLGLKQTPELCRIEADYAKRGVNFLFLESLDTEQEANLRKLGLAGKLARDPDGSARRLLGAQTSTEIFVLDAARTLVYAGAIDDQYGIGYQKDAPTRRFLRPALDAVLAGKPVAVPATLSPGCALSLTPPNTEVTGTEITYHNKISRIIQTNCAECHRDGGVAPFVLTSHAALKAKSGMVSNVVSDGLMPPWFARPQDGAAHSLWANDRTLPAQDKKDLLAWIAGGMPEGDPKDAPLPREFPKEWNIGQPDATWQIPQPIAVKAEGRMPYQNVHVETGVSEDKWVQGWEVRPTAQAVVHHVLVFATKGGRKPGGGRISNNDQNEGGAYFAAYVPGNNWVMYPEGFAKLLPAGSTLHFQIHYTPNGTATTDQVRLDVVYAKQAPLHKVEVTSIQQARLRIPPGAAHHPEASSIPVPVPVKVLGFMPHMHLRGKAFRFDAILPDGAAHTLLDVPNYDFNWQLAYRYAEPLSLPAGSRVRATGWFDNSAANPANPDPKREVRWGPQTEDEMMLGYVEYFLE